MTSHHRIIHQATSRRRFRRAFGVWVPYGYGCTYMFVFFSILLDSLLVLFLYLATCIHSSQNSLSIFFHRAPLSTRPYRYPMLYRLELIH